MRRLPLPDFWYGEACLRPDGSQGYWASPISGSFVQTEKKQFVTDPLLFTRGFPAGKFAGQDAIGLTGNKEYLEADGSGRVVGDGYGENTVLYLANGTLVQGKPEYGADGLRYQADDGSIVTSDRSRESPDGKLANYTELHGIRVGSDQIAGLGAIIEVVATGKRYILESGDCRNIRFNFYEPNILAVYMVKLLEKRAVAIWLTVDEIPSLLPYPTPPPDIGSIGLSRPADGRLYDMGPFIHCDPALAGRGGPGQQENFQVERPDGVVLYGKFGQAGSYEVYAVDSNWMTNLGDASGPDVIQTWTDPRWFPMRMAVGEQHAFVTDQHEAVYIDRHTCKVVDRVPFRRKMWLHALWPTFQWGEDLGVIATAMRVYDPTDGFLSEKRIIEVRLEAWHAGWCRWEAHRSDKVYPRGYKGGAEFTAASLVQQVDFYRLGGNRVQPALSNCVQIVVPHLPPWNPTPPPTSGFVKPAIFKLGGSMLQEKGGILGVGGKFARFGPIGSGLFGRRGLIWDGAAPTGDYEFTLTETSIGRGQAVDTKNGAMLGADLTQYSTDETHQFYGLKPGETPGEYETPFLYVETDQNVKTLVFRFPQGSDRPNPFSTSVTWVTQ